MSNEKLLATINALPVTAQLQVADFVDFLSQQHQRSLLKPNASVKVSPELSPKLSPKPNIEANVVPLPKQQHIADSFGIIRCNRSVTLDEMDAAIASLGGEIADH